MKLDAAVVTLVVLVHHAIAYVHGGAHGELAIDMSALQNAFINFVILVMPLAGAALTWTHWVRFGLWAVVLGMTGALVFGVYHHYMLVSPDHISHLPAGTPHVHDTFRWTAGAIAMLEGVGAMLAAYFLGRRHRDATAAWPAGK
jgi:hypothetical protein